MTQGFNSNESGADLFNKLNTLNQEVETLKTDGSGNPQTGITHDKPETLGEYYLVRKAEEMVKVSSYLKGVIAAPNHTYSSGDTMVGLPYSSVRKYNTFVPNYVSFETYLTALSDPNSYAYTENPGHGAYGCLYYGATCGVFAAYCLGLKVLRHTNWNWFGIPGFEKLETQDAQAMRIGFLMNTSKNGHTHVRVCVGITRNNGVVTNIRVGEGTDPVTKFTDYTAEEFNAELNDYTLLRYNKLDENTYDPEKSAYNLPFLNPNIMPKKGNKANWSTTENVIIDVLDKGTFTQYVVVKDGVEASPVNIGSGTTINLGHMAYGKYSLYLTNGTNNSAPVEWIVVDIQMSAEARSGGIVRFTFSSANATPIACAWGRPSDYMLNLVYELSKEDIAKGYKDTFLSTEHMSNYGVSGYEGKGTEYDSYHTYYTTEGNKIRPRMFFETEFGIINTDWGTDSDNITYID